MPGCTAKVTLATAILRSWRINFSGVVLAQPRINLNEEPTKLSDLVIVIENVIRLLAPAAGVAFLIMIIWSGFQFLTSGGDQKAVAGARTTLTFAILGIFLVIISWLLLLLVKNLTGVDVTTVEIPESD